VLRWIVSRLGRRSQLARQLRTPKTLQKYLDGLAAQRPEQALRTISALFDEAGSLDLPLPRLVAALDASDIYAQRLCLVLRDTLLENVPKQIVSEATLNTLLTYYRARERGYRLCLAKLPTALPGNEQTYATSVVFACRAANALSKRCLLLGMTYAAPGQDVWMQIGRLAAECRVAARSLAVTSLYGDELEQTSLERELLVMLMFQAAPIANLLPSQHHALDLLLRRYAEHFEMRDRFDPEARPFVIESSDNWRPVRWLPGRKERAGMKFFGPGFAGVEFLRERDRLASTRKVPHFAAPSGVALPLFRDLLDRLIHHWSLAPPTRRNRRSASEGTILVARDLTHIHRLVGFSELARSGHSLGRDANSDYAVDAILRAREMPDRNYATAPAKPPSDAEALENLKSYEDALGRDATMTWTLIDSSDAGLGAETLTWGPRLTVGLLVAFRHPDSIDWKLATVRRLSRGEGAKIRVGLELIEGHPLPVRLSLERGTTAAELTLGPALHYDALKLVGATASLIVPPGVFGASWHYRLNEQRRWNVIEVAAQRESGLDFERAQFSVVEASKAA
jgi:hypothetical protein